MPAHRGGRSGNPHLLSLSARPDRELGLRLRDARRRAGYTQTEVAEKLGYTASAVSLWETGRRGISGADLVKYAALLHMSIADIIGDNALPTFATDTISFTEV